MPAVKRSERRGFFAAFATLFAMLAALALLETGRDALFLARVPPSHLAFVYLAIAGLALPLSWAHRQSSSPRGLAELLAGSALVTAAMWLVVGRESVFWLYALYVWSGVYSTLAVTRFWLVLGSHYTVGQAKRFYGFIGAGSVTGAIAGSLLARTFAWMLPARHLLVVAAAVLLVAALTALGLPRHRGDRGQPQETERPSFGAEVRAVLSHPYLSRVGGLVLVSSATLILLDFVFKTLVVQSVAPARLAEVFANVQIVLNVLSLVTQLTLVGWMLRTAGVVRMLCVLPALLMVLGAGAAASAGLVTAILLKAADGAFRYSLHRTGIELLFVPVAERLRQSAKSFADLAGQRVGQALASLAILVAVGFGADARVVALVLTGLAAIWLFIGVRFRRPYLELFREAVREGIIDSRAGLPPLDLAAVETLLAALSSPRDSEVVAALDLLAAQKRDRLVPTLILYHPSRDVLMRALRLFADVRRSDIVPMLDRLLEHGDADVRAAALRARAAVAPDVALFKAKLADESPRVSATARVGLARQGGGDAEALLRPVLAGEDVAARRALALAIREQPSEAFTSMLLELGRDPDVEVRLETARAMSAAPQIRFLPVLLEMLAVRRLQTTAREAILAVGEAALPTLGAALADGQLSHGVRRNVPRCLGELGTAEAGAGLLRRLLEEPRGMVRFQILRTLGRMRRHNPKLPLDAATLDAAVEQAVTAIYRLMHWRTSLEAEMVRTPLYELFVTTLRDKERHGLERLFRLLGLRYEGEEFEPIYLGLRSADSNLQASSVELLENVLSPPLREAVIGIVDDLPDPERLLSAGKYYQAEAMTRTAVLEAIFESGGETLCAFAAYQVGILRLEHLRPRLEALSRGGKFLPEVVGHALELLTRPRVGEVAYAG